MRFKEQEKRLTLNERDDDDDEWVVCDFARSGSTAYFQNTESSYNKFEQIKHEHVPNKPVSDFRTSIRHSEI